MFCVLFLIFGQAEGTDQIWFDCTWFCKVLRRTRGRVLYLGD